MHKPSLSIYLSLFLFVSEKSQTGGGRVSLALADLVVQLPKRGRSRRAVHVVVSVSPDKN